jgi:hypothetical protein
MKRNEKFRELLANLNRALAGHEGYIQKRGALIEFARDKGEFSEKKAAPLFNLALDGDPDASAALCFFAGKLLLEGKELPPLLRKYVGILLGQIFERKPPRSRGASPYTNTVRDHFMLMAIDAYCKKFGWHATRGEATKHNRRRLSACALVSRDLDMNERAVEEIWAKRGKFGRG